MTAVPDQRRRAFDDPDVAKAYVHRAPYPPALFVRLQELAPRADRLLDLGCGPGKLTLPLAARFRHVDAVDPAEPMIAAAKASNAAPNIRWIVADAEDAPLAGEYDLVTAGASIHWMRPEALFPRLRPHLSPGAVFAVVAGDEPHDPPWAAQWPGFVRRWVERMGGVYDRPAFAAEGNAYRSWLDIGDDEFIASTVRQSVADFIEGEHSRGTWTRRKMGSERAATFDAELAELLAPHAQDGWLTFEVRTRLTHGRLTTERQGA